MPRTILKLSRPKAAPTEISPSEKNPEISRVKSVVTFRTTTVGSCDGQDIKQIDFPMSRRSWTAPQYREPVRSDYSEQESPTPAAIGRLPHATDPRDAFCPLYSDCKQTAKLLIRVTCAKLGSSLDTVARIYGYRDAYGLRKRLETQKYLGPYDEEHEAYWQSAEGQNRKRERLARIMKILMTDCPWLFAGSPGPEPHFIESLMLFSRIPVQRTAFLHLKIKKLSADDRADVRKWNVDLDSELE